MKTSYRTCVLHNFKDAVVYKAECACGSDEDALILELEVDGGLMYLTMYKDLACCSYWDCDNWFAEKWKRIKIATRMLFTGYIEVQECFIFDSEEHIDGFIQALTEGKERLKEGMKDAT